MFLRVTLLKVYTLTFQSLPREDIMGKYHLLIVIIQVPFTTVRNKDISFPGYLSFSPVFLYLRVAALFTSMSNGLLRKALVKHYNNT